MKVINTVIIGNGPASHYIGFFERNSEVIVLDASYATHSYTPFGKRIRTLSGGTMGLWGGNLFFDFQFLESYSAHRIENFLSYISVDSDVKRYENEFGFGVLLPKGYTFKEFHPTIYEPVVKFRKVGKYFEVYTINLKLLCTKLYLATGSTMRMRGDDDGWVYLDASMNNVKYDKLMRFDFSDQDYGPVSMCLDNNAQYISRFRLNNFGYEAIDENYLLKLTHFFNQQISVTGLMSMQSIRLAPPIFNRIFKRKRNRWMYLTTISDFGKGRNILKIDPSKKEKLYCRALHTEIFQSPGSLDTLDSLGVVHDQKSSNEHGWRFGSVGGQISLLNNRIVL